MGGRIFFPCKLQSTAHPPQPPYPPQPPQHAGSSCTAVFLQAVSFSTCFLFTAPQELSLIGVSMRCLLDAQSIKEIFARNVSTK